jgi:hypothetical protein
MLVHYEHDDGSCWQRSTTIEYVASDSFYGKLQDSEFIITNSAIYLHKGGKTKSRT